MSSNVYTLPPDLPVPVDDGAADHLRGAVVPSLALAATSGRAVSLAELARRPAVLFFYPRRIAHVWYPAFPPDKNAEVVLAWLGARRP